MFGDGPDRPALERAVAAHGLDGAVRMHGFVDESVLDDAMRRALCVVLPSRREGYGLVVIEAAARGVPAVVVEAADSAAAELVSDGENGVLAPSASPEDLAQAIVRVHAAGEALRASTARWFERNAERLSLDGSLRAMVERYRA